MVFTDLTNDPSATQFTFVVTFLIIFFVAALTWTIYSRTTTRRIENKLKQEGYEGMLSWDGNLGIKSIVLAFALGMRIGPFTTAKTPLIDGSVVNKFAKKRDIIFSQFHIFVSFLFIGSIFFGSFVLKLY